LLIKSKGPHGVVIHHESRFLPAYLESAGFCQDGEQVTNVLPVAQQAAHWAAIDLLGPWLISG